MLKATKWVSLSIMLLPYLVEAGSAHTFPKTNSLDSIETSLITEIAYIPNREIKPGPDDRKPNQNYDFRKDGLFKALFHVGVNLAQIDGDAYAGYTKVGFDGGVGALVRFHKYFSTSMELNFTMWGANDGFFGSTSNLYRVQTDYIQVPLAINVHDKEIVMFSAGLNLGFLIYYNERRENGVDSTDFVQPQPKKFDLDAFAQVHFLIKRQFGIGFKFSYSIIPIRGVEQQYQPLTRIHGEYNNTITIRFMYILNAWKKK